MTFLEERRPAVGEPDIEIVDEFSPLRSGSIEYYGRRRRRSSSRYREAVLELGIGKVWETIEVARYISLATNGNFYSRAGCERPGLIGDLLEKEILTMIAESPLHRDKLASIINYDFPREVGAMDKFKILLDQHNNSPADTTKF